MTGFSDATKQAIADRARLLCEVGIADGCFGFTPCDTIHHRLPRGMGGTSDPQVNAVTNGLAVCAQCHDWVESHRTEARGKGWLVAHPKVPAQVPVMLHGRRWVWLTADGDYRDVDDVSEADRADHEYAEWQDREAWA